MTTTTETHTQKDGRRLFEEDRARMLADPEYRHLYEEEAAKKELWLQLVEARQASGLTQAELAKRLAVLAGTGGYFLGSRVGRAPQLGRTVIQPPQQPRQIPVPTVVETLMPTMIDGTIGWEVYRNSAYGIEVKYPPTWFVREGAGAANDVVELFENREASRSDAVVSDYFKVSVHEGVSFQKFVDDRINGRLTPIRSTCRFFNLSDGKLHGEIIVESVSISGVAAVKLRCNEEARAAVLEDFVEVLVPRNRTVFELLFTRLGGLEGPPGPLPEESLTTLSRMLAGFRFF